MCQVISPLHRNKMIICYQWNWWQSHSSWAQAWESYRWERLPRSFSSSKLSSSLSAENWHVIVINKLKIDLLTCLLFKAAKALPLFLMIFKMFMLKKVKVAKGRRFSSTVLKKTIFRMLEWRGFYCLIGCLWLLVLNMSNMEVMKKMARVLLIIGGC